MVTPAQLEAFDLLLWVGIGEEAARISSLSQPTISRSAHHVAQTLGLTLRKVRSEWQLAGEESRLAQARTRHQQSRLQGKGRLRLEAGALSSRLVAEPAPAGWILGRPDAINQPRSLGLLHQRVIDAWICTSALDLPDGPELEDLAVLELFRMPLRLVASRHHPLAGRKGLQAADLSPFPSVALADHWYPRSAAQLQKHGLWRNPRHLNHHPPQHWEGPHRGWADPRLCLCLGAGSQPGALPPRLRPGSGAVPGPRGAPGARRAAPPPGAPGGTPEAGGDPPGRALTGRLPCRKAKSAWGSQPNPSGRTRLLERDTLAGAAPSPGRAGAWGRASTLKASDQRSPSPRNGATEWGCQAGNT